MNALASLHTLTKQADILSRKRFFANLLDRVKVFFSFDLVLLAVLNSIDCSVSEVATQKFIVDIMLHHSSLQRRRIPGRLRYDHLVILAPSDILEHVRHLVNVILGATSGHLS